MNDCIFCRILSGKIPAYRVSESDETLTILDAFPMANGHVLVISKTHKEYFHQLEKEILKDIITECQNICEILSKKFKMKEYNLMVNNGTSAGQSIPHVHFHIIPRRAGDKTIQFRHGDKQDPSYYSDLVNLLKD